MAGFYVILGNPVKGKRRFRVSFFARYDGWKSEMQNLLLDNDLKRLRQERLPTLPAVV
jgi:hypothetical protein